jgi:hypothetical protein
MDLSARGPWMKAGLLTLLTVLISSCIALDAFFSLRTIPLAVGLCQRIWVPFSITLVFILQLDSGSETSPGATPIHTIKPFPQCLSLISTISSSSALSLPFSMPGTLIRHQQLICSTSFFLHNADTFSHPSMLTCTRSQRCGQCLGNISFLALD